MAIPCRGERGLCALDSGCERETGGPETAKALQKKLLQGLWIVLIRLKICRIPVKMKFFQCRGRKDRRDSQRLNASISFQI